MRRSLRGESLCRLAVCLLLIGAIGPAKSSARPVVKSGAATIWKYVDDGQQPDAAWQTVDFDDSQWKSGKAPLGYGRSNVGTEVGFGSDKNHKLITTYFRHSFDRPELKPGERLVAVFCIDDGAVFYLNGQRLGATNMPQGPIDSRTVAPQSIGTADEDLYQRMPVPSSALRPGRNVLAVEVHQCSPTSHDLFFDLALKTMPPDDPAPAVSESARAVVETFNRQHYIGPGVTIPDGYLDGGRGMKLDAEGRPRSHREILVVDRARDEQLTRFLAFARSPDLKTLPMLERAQRLAVYIHQETTPPGGMRYDMKTCELLEKEFANKPVLIGDWIDQGQAGVCRHRSLLFKILGDEAGLNAALVRGNFAGSSDQAGGHAWNEITLEDGRRVLVDVTIKLDKQDFPEVTSPAVAAHYLRVDNKPWYQAKAEQ
jgi:hypothetical protein